MRRLINILLLMLFSAVSATAQQLVDTPFNGLIVDGSGKGIAKVKITIAGSTKRTSTDKQGRFGLTNLGDDVVLNLAGKGIKDLKVPVVGRSSLHIVIENGVVVEAQESQALTDAGFNYIRKREHSLGSGVITGEELRRSNQTDFEKALLSRVSGLVKVNGELQLRGFYSVNAEPKTLLLVDGSQVLDFSHVNIHEVESVTVYKDGASVFGLRGFAGAIDVKLRSL